MPTASAFQPTWPAPAVFDLLGAAAAAPLEPVAKATGALATMGVLEPDGAEPDKPLE